MDERLKQQLEFVLEIDKEKNIFRQTHLSGQGRNENDAEHAWHMAIMAYLLREYSNEPVDIGRGMLMCLIHDIVEIDAGDTYAYDADGLKTQKAREDAAKERIFSLLPEDQKQELVRIVDEFEAFQTPEAKFARAMDNLQPLLLNDSNDGGDWKEHEVNAEKVYGRQRKTKRGSEKLFEVTDQILKENIAKGNFRFASSMYLEDVLNKIDNMPQKNFDDIIKKYVEMNIAHPFREGNGRSTRIWLDLILKKELNKVIDWSKINKEDYLLAMERSPVRDLEIRLLLQDALTNKINDRQVFMKGLDTSYEYEGYNTYCTEKLGNN